MKKPNAIIFTNGILNHPNAKTAHGLIRLSSRYDIVAVIDPEFGGQDAGMVLDQKPRGIPVYSSVDKIGNQLMEEKISYAIIGIALPGGRIPDSLRAEISLALKQGISIVSGSHDFLTDDPEFSRLAAQYGASLIDIRKPRPKCELKFWTGEVLSVPTPVIGVLGTDCALGKRTTTSLLTASLQFSGVNAQMVYTGQTGWLQGYKYGFILDSTYNDFISGELEHAVVTCYKETSPDVIIMEGQSSLCNPSGPCGAEYLLSACVKGVILQHAPGRIYYNGHEKTGIKIDLQKEIDLIHLYGAKILAITLNTGGVSAEEIKQYKKVYQEKYGIPIILPLQEIEDLNSVVVKYIQS